MYSLCIHRILPPGRWERQFYWAFGDLTFSPASGGLGQMGALKFFTFFLGGVRVFQLALRGRGIPPMGGLGNFAWGQVFNWVKETFGWRRFLLEGRMSKCLASGLTSILPVGKILATKDKVS